MICLDCDHHYDLPYDSGDPFEKPCPNCASTNICRQFDSVISQCIDPMRECRLCPFENNCTLNAKSEEQ